MKVGGDFIPKFFLDVFRGRFQPVLREELERITRDVIEDPDFPYPHLKATLTSLKSLLDAADASKYGFVEDAREISRLVLATRGPRAFPGFRGGAATAAPVRPSLRLSLIHI